MKKTICLLLSLLTAALCFPLYTGAAAQSAYEVTEEYTDTLPEGLTLNLQYSNYSMYFHYLVAEKKTTLYAEPSTASAALTTIRVGERVPCNARVKAADGSSWLRLTWEGKTAFAQDVDGAYRQYRFDEAMNRIRIMEPIAEDPFTAMVANYKNAKGLPAVLGNGQSVDSRGYFRTQSSAAYAEPVVENALCYIPDGMILIAYESYNSMTRVYSPTWDAYYWVQDKYLIKGDALNDLRQVYFVDVTNQNIIALEKNAEEQWEVIGLSIVSSGDDYSSARPTPDGDYRVIETRKKFVYDNNDDKIYDGYAMWATRFSCGAYLHGAAAGYTYDPITQGDMSTIPDKAPEGSPYELGTVPKSHMCVRNFTSFAKFIYDRAVPTEAMVIVSGKWRQH